MFSYSFRKEKKMLSSLQQPAPKAEVTTFNIYRCNGWFWFRF